jgi:predicted MFS family arabinose efflux permease
MLVFLGAALLCSVVSLYAFKDLESSAKRPSANKTAILTPLTYSGAIEIYLICGLFMTSFYGLYAFTGAHAVEGFKQTIAQAGYIGLMYGIGFGLGSINAGRLDKVNKHHALSISLCCGASALIASAFAANFWLFLVIFSLIGVANSLVVNLIVIRVGALSEIAKGASLSLYTTISYIGVTVGTLGFGLVYEHNGFKWIALLAAGFCILAMLLNNQRQKTLFKK